MAPIAAIIGAPALAVGIDAALRELARRTFAVPLAPDRDGSDESSSCVLAADRRRSPASSSSCQHDLVPPGAGRASSESCRSRASSSFTEQRARRPHPRLVRVGRLRRSATMYELGARVMVDGRNDMYDDVDPRGVRPGAALPMPGWEEIVDRWRGRRSAVPAARGDHQVDPPRCAGWCEAFRDENEVVYLRDCPSAQR